MTKKKTKKQIKLNSNAILTIIFFLLLILVIILAIICLTKKNKEVRKVDLEVPIMSDNLTANISVDITDLKINTIKEYNLDISNYNDKLINDKKISYDLIFTKSEGIDATLSLTKNGVDNNLLKEKEKVEKQILKYKKRQIDNYNLKIRLNKNTSKEKKQYINIKIEGKEQ